MKKINTQKVLSPQKTPLVASLGKSPRLNQPQKPEAAQGAKNPLAINPTFRESSPKQKIT